MSFELRHYQNNIVDSLRASLKKNKRVLIYAPTGAGKTKISQYIIERLINSGKRVLFTTPRIKLAVQTQKSFGFGNLILGEKTENNESLCTIASIQSLYSRKITQPFDVIFIDECHFAHGSEYQNYIFETYKDSYIIGLSATPIDENGYMLHGYDDVIKEVGITQLIKDNFLCDVDVFTSHIQPRTESISVINGDYNMSEASKIVTEENILSNAISEWQKYAANKKTLVFACDIAHAEKMTYEFKRIGVKVAAVHSNLGSVNIDFNYAQFNLNKIQVLINVDMATFGFDEPDIDCLLFVRPIRSLRLYKQMVGRGLRTSPKKDKCLILDCANIIMDNGYPTDDIPFKIKPVINTTVDKVLNIQRETSGEIKKENLTKERVEYLTKIGSLIDLYADKVYNKEQDLVDDCKTILKRAGFFFWRQNSGKMFKDTRWVHFTDKNGLPDITLIYHGVYIGLELKLEKGTLTKYQKETLPEMMINKTMFFIIENVVDLFSALEKIKNNIVEDEKGILIKREIFERDEKQQEYFNKYKLNQ